MKTIHILVFFSLTALSFGQKIDRPEPFISSDYPKEKFQITTDTIQFFNMVIESRMVRNNSGYDPFRCRAWLTIKKNGKPNFQRYFRSIMAVGGCYGLFFPTTQPRHDYFIFQKSGDYDPRIFIVDSIGNIIEKPGGDIYVSKDNRYLFSQYNPGDHLFTVYDFTKGSCVFSDIIKPNLGDWYFQDNLFINQMFHFGSSSSDREYMIFDLESNKLIPYKNNDLILKESNKLINYTSRGNLYDCNCGLERYNIRK